jgi:hypothetical protein
MSWASAEAARWRNSASPVPRFFLGRQRRALVEVVTVCVACIHYPSSDDLVIELIVVVTVMIGFVLLVRFRKQGRY